MLDVDINRSIQFVSLDTHPAKNALVVTYEILASVSDRSTKLEISRRNKRAQLHINISVLDQLTRDDLKADKLVINLKELSEEIVSKCPMLLSERHNFEDIQLHLLYLINRRQSNLLAEVDEHYASALHDASGRPASTSFQRLRSARGAKMRLSAGYSHRISSLKSKSTPSETDIYSYLQAKESSNSLNANHNELIDEFMISFDDYLSDLECRRQAQTNQTWDTPGDLENQLEGLYGDKTEKQAAMASLRQFSKADLARMSSNRLLVCAMLRIMRDSDTESDHYLCLSILFILIRFTTYEDVYRQTFLADDQPIDLIGLVADLLFNQVQVLVNVKAADSNSSELLSMNDDGYFYTTSLVMLTMNLFKLDSFTAYQSQKSLLSRNRQLQDKQISWFVCLFELIQIISRQLTKELRLTTNMTLLLCVHRSIDLLNGLVNLLIQLSIFKEFIQQIRTSSGQLQLLVADSLTGLMITLQLTRPGSGKPLALPSEQQPARAPSGQPASSSVLNDQQTLNEIYELEIRLLRLVGNLILDHRLRLRLIKRNLLKCVLRNLVVFLASRKSMDSLSPFHQSAVLIEPFKCLYELSCTNEVKNELYRSKIIIKCLLEYLLSSTIDLRAQLTNGGPTGLPVEATIEPLANRVMMDDREENVQISVEPRSAQYYVVSLWVNLSAQSVSPIYGSDIQLGQLISEYIGASLGNLQLFLVKANENRRPNKPSWISGDDELIMVYLHAKLLRNVSQFFGRNQEPDSSDWPLVECYAEWTQKIGVMVCKLISSEQVQLFTPIAVELLVTMSNFILSRKRISSVGGDNSKQENRWLDDATMSKLFEKLFSLDLNDFEPSENDDLILASVGLLGTVAHCRDICRSLELEPKLTAGIITASNIIFGVRTTDQQMTLSGLNALCQLTNHVGFLRELSSWEPQSTERVHLRQLVGKLAHLMLNGHQSMVAKLASHLLVRLEQLDRSSLTFEGGEDKSGEEQFVHTNRFASYNGKWLSAIRESRNDSTGSGGANNKLLHNSVLDDAEEENEDEDEDEDDDSSFGWVQRRQAGSSSARPRSSLLTSSADELGTGGIKLFGAEELSEGSSAATAATARRNRPLEAELEGSGSDLDDPDEIGFDEDGPDFDVVDANSMIKHLTSRREFRSKWPIQQ